MNLKLIGSRIREARERLSLSQEDLANLIGKSQNAVSDYEHGRRAIRISELPELASALKVPIASFFGDEYPDDEALALIAQLSSERRREILARLRLEVELQRQAELEKERK